MRSATHLGEQFGLGGESEGNLLLAGQRNVANFVGQWVPTILIVGLYNKLVKLEGSE